MPTTILHCDLDTPRELLDEQIEKCSAVAARVRVPRPIISRWRSDACATSPSLVASTHVVHRAGDNLARTES